jgi:hypothetical protein
MELTHAADSVSEVGLGSLFQEEPCHRRAPDFVQDWGEGVGSGRSIRAFVLTDA